MEMPELLKWITGMASLLFVHVYLAGVRAKHLIHARIDKLQEKLDRRDQAWRDELVKLHTKLDEHHVEFLQGLHEVAQRVVHVEAVIQRHNGR